MTARSEVSFGNRTVAGVAALPSEYKLHRLHYRDISRIAEAMLTLMELIDGGDERRVSPARSPFSVQDQLRSGPATLAISSFNREAEFRSRSVSSL